MLFYRLSALARSSSLSHYPPFFAQLESQRDSGREPSGNPTCFLTSQSRSMMMSLHHLTIVSPFCRHLRWLHVVFLSRYLLPFLWSLLGALLSSLTFSCFSLAARPLIMLKAPYLLYWLFSVPSAASVTRITLLSSQMCVCPISFTRVFPYHIFI